MTEKAGRLDEAVRRFFEVHREDPKSVERDGTAIAWSVLYHERMAFWLHRLAPGASEPLRLAANAQHMRRWDIPRQNYPLGKIGYRKWRRELAHYHGEKAGEILADVGYDAATVNRVKELLLKARIQSDPEQQILEDVACLVFLENEFAAFAKQHAEEKLAIILQKTWKKMSPAGHEEALKLVAELPDNLRALVHRALREE